MDTPGLKGELQPEYLEAEVYSMNTVHPPPPKGVWSQEHSEPPLR